MSSLVGHQQKTRHAGSVGWLVDPELTYSVFIFANVQFSCRWQYKPKVKNISVSLNGGEEETALYEYKITGLSILY